MKKLTLPALLLAATACTMPPPVETVDPTIDQAELARFRRAVPKKQNLSAALPESIAGTGALVGDPAVYPQMAVPHVVGVNTLIGNILDTVEAVVATPPTLFNSETHEFLWGPFDNGDSPLEGDKALVYIREQPEGEDFQFVFAFARLMGDDVASAVPVIWGGVNPNPDDEDQGSGVLLLDFEASRAFGEANGADVTTEARGRFAAGFARGPNDDGSDSMVTIVIGSFRGFNGEGGTEVVNVDHLWGNVTGADGNTIDFMNLAIEGNVLQDTTAAETLDMQLVLWNRGLGRGEVVLTGGDAGANIGDGTECWDAAVEQQYYQVVVTDEAGTETVIETEGDAATGCPAPFDVPLADLGIPTLADVDQGILGALQNAAENGLGG
ncbi:MAG: hypothetical protein A2138_01315 [Deltaproteobacteria bacterium RBG_16_71_12]|nr:MAG: hypothetical protein A2138_01315 [Deltaproteobacteria bacterium RBG_16_71_12]